ncbi:MAG: alanine racemase, partial [Acidimicrobiales bacterium]
MAEAGSRPAWAEVDLGAVRHNAAVLRRLAAPAALWAVVKADGYGHGAAAVARAAVEGGAAGLAVATVEEGVELRRAGVARPVLLLSEPPPDAYDDVVAAGLVPTLCTGEAVSRAGASARRLGSPVGVHVKVDTGMHRFGADPASVPALASAVRGDPALRLDGLWTHLAVADGASTEDRAFTAGQLDRFDEVVTQLGTRPKLLHAANSAATMAWPRARYDMVRCGIALYGVPPAPGLVPPGLVPVLSLRARVVAVRELGAGERPSYGRLRPLPERSVVATVPIGYADGVPRRLFSTGCSVLVRGERRPLAGMVTMDHIVVDCGPGSPVAPGDEVTLLGRQGDEEVTAAEWAGLLGTIGYEVLCGIGSRVPRVPAGEPAGGWRPRLARGGA